MVKGANGTKLRSLRMPLKDEIFRALSRESLSIAELCKQFGVTRNAVVVQINQLLSAGLVAPSVAPRQGKVGKPATLYSAVAGNEDRRSTAYRTLSTMFASALGRRFNEQERAAFYRSMGEVEGQAMRLPNGASDEQRLAHAKEIADAMGANAEIHSRDDHVVLSSFTCPIASVVRAEPCGCDFMAALFENLTDMPTTSKCARKDRLVCRFELKREKISAG